MSLRCLLWFKGIFVVSDLIHKYSISSLQLLHAGKRWTIPIIQDTSSFPDCAPTVVKTISCFFGSSESKQITHTIARDLRVTTNDSLERRKAN